MYIETDYALYMLAKPSWQYKELYTNFYSPHRIAQLVISMAHQDQDKCTKETFFDWYNGLFDDLLSEVITKERIHQAVSLFCYYK